MSDKTITIKGSQPGEADFYYPLDRVLDAIIAALKAGHVDQAVDVYSRCREDIGFQLIARAQADSHLFQATANVFFRARDYARAAFCCEQLEEHLKAAELYERCDDWAQAAQMYASAGNPSKAAEMFLKCGNLVEAGRLYRDMSDPLQAAACFERARRPFDAATMYQQAGRLEKAIEVLNTVDEESSERKIATKVIRELLAEAKLQRAGGGQVPGGSASTERLPGESSGAASPPQDLLELEEGAIVPASPSTGGVGEDGRGIVTMMDGFDVLRELPLFAQLSLTELKSVYHLCEVQQVQPGDVVIQEGQPAPALFVVMGGSLEVRTAAGDKVAELGVGEHAGEMSLIDDTPAGVSVVVAASGRVLRLDKNGFRAALVASDALALRVMRVFIRVLTERLRETTARVGR